MEPNEKLLASIAARHKLGSLLKEVFFAWPNLRTATLRLMDYMGDVIPSKEGGLLSEKCIIAATDEYLAVHHDKAGTTEQMRAFLRGLLKYATEINNYHVVISVDRKQHVWDPLSDKAVTEWVAGFGAKHEVVESRYSTATDSGFRQMLVARIIGLRDVEWIEDGEIGDPPARRASLCTFLEASP